MKQGVLFRLNLVSIVFLVGAILLAITGQFFLAQHLYLPAAVLYAVALIYWVFMMGDRRTLVPAAELNDPPEDATISARKTQGEDFIAVFLRNRSALLPVPLALAAFTFLTSTNNTFTLLNVSLWVLSIVSFVVLFAERPTRPHVKNIYLILGGLILLLLLGGFFYYYHLDQVPGEMTSDHAEKLQDIYDVLNGKRPIFFTRNTGREPLEFYLVSSFIALIHHRLDYMSLKWVTATIGLLVVPVTFFIGHVLFDDWVGWLAGAFVAINLWGVGIARMGLRFPFTPFFTALTFLFFFRALKYQRRNDYLLAGLFLGAGLYGYHAFKIAPLVVAGCFVLWLLLEGHIGAALRRRANWREIGRVGSNFMLLVLFSVIVFMPLFRYMVDHPESFWQRVLTRVSDEERPLPGNPVAIFADNLKNDLLMFNVEGDHSWPNTLSDVPVLDEVSGGLFVLGVGYGLYRWLRYREKVYAYVLAVLVGLLLPSALAIAFPIENPSVVRAGGAIPFVLLIVALPLSRLVRALRNIPGRLGWALAGVAILALLAVSVQLNYTRYFVKFDEQYRSNSWNSSEMAATMLDFVQHGGKIDHAWVVAFPYWVDTRNVAINIGNIEWDNVLWHVKEMPDPSHDPAPRLYILSVQDQENLQALESIFPQGVMSVYPSRTSGKEYIGFYVPPRLSN
ncbi:MAG: glycosyltransferase family 39 protein [Anaerolineae bacterium]